MTDLDHFAQRGYVRLRRAVDGDLVRRWRGATFERLRTAAATELMDSAPPSSPEAFATLDEDDPRTWAWRRATLKGTETVDLRDVAPAVWAALAELLGDRGLRRSTMTNYLILSFPRPNERGKAAGWATRVASFFRKPKPFGGGFHLDDPTRSMSLDGWRNAALLLVLYTDILPQGGGTVLLPESPPKVARCLAVGDANFVDGEGETQGIVDACAERLQITGEAGDVFLMHPFLLHGTAPNLGRHVRIVGNPMLEAGSTLNFRPGTEARSPLEEITQAWASG